MLTKTQIKFLQAGAILAFGLFMTFVYWLMTGINEDFGWGIISGLFIGAGVIFLASRQARDYEF